MLYGPILKNKNKKNPKYFKLCLEEILKKISTRAKQVGMGKKCLIVNL